MHVALMSVLKVHDPTPSRDACSEALWFQSAGQIWPIMYVQIQAPLEGGKILYMGRFPDNVARIPD